MNSIIPIGLISILLVACTSTGSVKLAAEDPIEYKNYKKHIEGYWLIEKKQTPKYPVNAVKAKLSGCVEFIIGIDKQGKAGFHKIKKSYPKGIFDKSATAALNNYKWSATDTNTERAPALTTIKLDFMIGRAKNKAEAKEHCGAPISQNL